MAGNVLEQSMHADAGVTGFVGIADRTQPQRVAGHRVFHPGMVGQRVRQTGGQDHAACAPPLGACNQYEGIAIALDRLHPHRFKARIEFAGLLPHPPQQFHAGNPIRKSGAVVALWNPACATVAVIEHHAGAVEAAQVSGSSQSGGSSTHNRDVEHGLIV